MIPILSYNVEPKMDIKEHSRKQLFTLPMLIDNEVSPQLLNYLNDKGIEIKEDDIVFRYLITTEQLNIKDDMKKISLFKGDLYEYLRDIDKKSVLDVKDIKEKSEYKNINKIDNLEDMLNDKIYRGTSLEYSMEFAPNELLEDKEATIYVYYYFELEDSENNKYLLINNGKNKVSSKVIDTLINSNNIEDNKLNLSKSVEYIYKALKEFGYGDLFNVYHVDFKTGTKFIPNDINNNGLVTVGHDYKSYSGNEMIIKTFMTKSNNIDIEHAYVGHLYHMFSSTVGNYGNFMYFKFPFIDFKDFYNNGGSNRDFWQLSSFYNNITYLKYIDNGFDNSLYELDKRTTLRKLPVPIDYSPLINNEYQRYSSKGTHMTLSDNMDITHNGTLFDNGFIANITDEILGTLQDYLKSKLESNILIQDIKVEIGNIDKNNVTTIPLLKEFTKDNPYIMNTRIYYSTP